jgi:ATP/maltotriose-dependent transcriptional regulator MalT/DNA-binding SARP family transcriptional activator
MEELKSTYPLIHNKVTSPRYVTPTLRRARLVDWLTAHAEARALVIAADAGYGKTTLLWQWEREVDFPCYWYKLDRNDRDWTLHISYLVEAISHHYPGFGRRAHSVLRQMGGPGSSRPGVAAYLLAEMHEKLKEPCTFIIDDWQYVAAVTEVRGLWNQILRDAPPSCRFVFASRGKPQLQFARFKTHGGYAELKTDDLRMTEAEIAELFRDVYRDPLTADEAAELERRTEGWAASLQLVEVSLRERHTPEERRALIESLTATSNSDLFAFLAEEVMEQQPEETRNFLLSTSILHQITPEVAERLAGVHDGTRRLMQLEHTGLFTYRLDESRFRYHGLFREFLERRLADERSDAEVMGLHIHAASYFETSSQWPDAIYHYLKAGLQRQAARLIARYGEDVVAEGRLGMVDEWLQQLPGKTIRDNARLSLLHGEALGIGGNWEAALTALERGRAFFERKGDLRMQALALIKLATLYSHWGNPTLGAKASSEALALAPADARDLKLRAEGDLVLTRQWLQSPFQEAQKTLMRLTAEALQLGLDHYTAIGFHNLGQMQLEMGEIDRGLKSLERAASLWNQAVSSPFADNYNLVLGLLLSGDIERADSFAKRGLRATRHWPRVHAQALAAMAKVQITLGKFHEAAETLDADVPLMLDLGSATELALGHFLEAKLLAGEVDSAALRSVDELESRSLDPRMAPNTLPPLASVVHEGKQCTPRCGMAAWETAKEWTKRGGILIGADAILRLAPVLLDHGYGGAESSVADAISRCTTLGTLRFHRFWLRRLIPFAERLAPEFDATQWAALVAADAPSWAPVAISVGLPRFKEPGRSIVLAAVDRHAEPSVIASLAEARPSPDISSLRLRLVTRHAPRLFIGSFGKLLVRRAGWDGSAVDISKKRERQFLSFLVAHSGEAVGRDQVLDALWPDASPSAAVNNLNQTVFQLRRALDPTYRDGASPAYILSSADDIALSPDLVKIDWVELKRRLSKGGNGDPHQDPDLEFALKVLRGQYLQDSLYEDWSEPPRQRVHQFVRSALLPLVNAQSIDAAMRVRIGTALVALDEFDEPAHIALGRALAKTGRRMAAVKLIRRLSDRLEDELSEAAPASLAEALAEFQEG